MEHLASDTEASLLPLPSSAVDCIPQNRMPDGGAMDPDLMGSTGFKGDLQQGNAPEPLPDLPLGMGGSRLSAGNGHQFPVDLMPPDGKGNLSGILRNIPVNQGQIGLLDRPLFELDRQVIQRRFGFGHHHDTGGVLIEPMHDPGPEFPPDAGQIPAMVKEGVDQGPGRMSRRRMHHHPGGLVDHQEMRIFV